jgi:hypothetical protein
MVGCSSKPEKIYQVENLQQASNSFMKLADRKRQQEEFKEATELYLRAEQYAVKRNNQLQVGISKLKRALINITLNNDQAAEKLIQQVELANRIEKLELTQPINFVHAKLLLNKGNNNQAFELLRNLEIHFQSDIERNAYYQLMRWSHDYQQLDITSIASLIGVLKARFDSKDLHNIEILSFAYLEHARWAVDNANLEQGELILEQAIEHFSQLELTAKIAKVLKYSADFYQRHGLDVKSDYYLAAFNRLKSDP